MTVEKLIEELRKYPQDTPVLYLSDKFEVRAFPVEMMGMVDFVPETENFGYLKSEIQKANSVLLMSRMMSGVFAPRERAAEIEMEPKSIP